MIGLTQQTKSAFYVGTFADICAASLFALICFVNRNHDAKYEKGEATAAFKKGSDPNEEKDSGVDEVKQLISLNLDMHTSWWTVLKI